ncbi:MAG: Ig-like domain-containing protein, partial [Methanofastidiosum sp.]|nr:Ig-like domain-containing protein [Methanofastidiosum sp.]
MKKALLVSMMLLFSMFAPFDFSGLDFNFAFAEEGTPKNSPPVAVNDFYKTEMNKQLTVAAPGVLENDSDPEGNMLLSAKLTDPANGMVVMGTDGKFIYVPKTDFTGVDSFTYTV